jgi:hypothetical protein
VTINPTTGVIELRDVAALDELTAEQPESSHGPLFGHVKDIKTASAKIPMGRSLRPAAGLSPDEVWAEIAENAPQTVDTDDVDAAVERTHGRIVVVDGPDALMSVFEPPLDLWRAFCMRRSSCCVPADSRRRHELHVADQTDLRRPNRDPPTV